MSEDIRRRAACDRCHGQKLRCPRKPGQQVCDRCTKANASCLYSPFRQKKCPGYSQKEIRGLQDQVSTSTEARPGSSSDESNIPERQVLKRRRGIEEPQNDHILSSTIRIQTEFQSIPSTPVDSTNSFSFIATQDFDTCSIFNDIDLGMQSPFPSLDINPPSPLPSSFSLKPDSLPFLNRSSVPFTYHHPVPQVQRQTSLMDLKLVAPTSTQFGSIPIAIGWKFQRETLSLDTVGRCVGRLSTLSTELYEHRTTLPSLKIHEPPTPEEDLDRILNPPVEYHLDETFRLTQEMIDIYPTVIDSCSSKHSIPLVNTSTSFQSGPQTKGTQDHSTLLLALSCHLRLIDIYDALFAHMQVCVYHRGNIPNINLTFVAPVVKIGNFTPPQSSSVPMQMLLFIQLASQLSSYSGDLVSAMKGLHDEVDNIENDTNPPSSISAFTLATAEGVSQKAEGMTKTLAELRHQILDSGFLA